MSAASDRPLVPAWLAEPADANALAPLVWPASTARDADGQLEIAGVGVAELRARFGTPLYVLDEDAVRSRAREVREAFTDAAAGRGVLAIGARQFDGKLGKINFRLHELLN